jgi:hypothetical protein
VWAVALALRETYEVHDEFIRLRCGNGRRWARLLVARSARLCPAPIAGASDIDNERRTVLVVAPDPVMRVSIADAITRHHDVIEADGSSPGSR